MIDPVAAGLVAIYCIAMIAIGVWASKKIQTMSDYVVAMIAVSLATPPHSDALLDETMTGWYIQK
jgi:hydrogenase/urease accessory protein HupE